MKTTVYESRTTTREEGREGATNNSCASARKCVCVCASAWASPARCAPVQRNRPSHTESSSSSSLPLHSMALEVLSAGRQPSQTSCSSGCCCCVYNIISQLYHLSEEEEEEVGEEEENELDCLLLLNDSDSGNRRG